MIRQVFSYHIECDRCRRRDLIHTHGVALLPTGWMACSAYILCVDCDPKLTYPKSIFGDEPDWYVQHRENLKIKTLASVR